MADRIALGSFLYNVLMLPVTIIFQEPTIFRLEGKWMLAAHYSMICGPMSVDFQATEKCNNADSSANACNSYTQQHRCDMLMTTLYRDKGQITYGVHSLGKRWSVWTQPLRVLPSVGINWTTVCELWLHCEVSNAWEYVTRSWTWEQETDCAIAEYTAYICNDYTFSINMLPFVLVVILLYIALGQLLEHH